MALTAYVQQTQRLLNDPLAAEFQVADLQTYVNIARAQLAADAECLRQPAAITAIAGQRAYSWASATFVGQGSVSGQGGLPVPQGLGAVLTAKNMACVTAAGTARMYVRSWPWLNYYLVQRLVPNSGQPLRWAEFEPGVNGSFYVDPVPNSALFGFLLDAVCVPSVLTQDSQPEPIPYPWTDAVPYYAAYLAYTNAQRMQDAQEMLTQYRLFARRGTQMTTPTQLPRAFPGGAGAREANAHQLIGGPSEGGR